MTQTPFREGASIAFDVFKQPHRYHILRALQAYGTPMTLEQLATHLRAAEPYAPGPELDRLTDRQLALTLHHNELSKLDRVGVIRYDPDDHVVTRIDEDRLQSLVAAGQDVLTSLEQDPYVGAEPIDS